MHICIYIFGLVYYGSECNFHIGEGSYRTLYEKEAHNYFAKTKVEVNRNHTFKIMVIANHNYIHLLTHIYTSISMLLVGVSSSTMCEEFSPGIEGI